MMNEWHEVFSAAFSAAIKFTIALQPKVAPVVEIVDDPQAVMLEWETDKYTAQFWFYENRTYEYRIVLHPEGFQIQLPDIQGEGVSADAPINEEFIHLLR